MPTKEDILKNLPRVILAILLYLLANSTGAISGYILRNYYSDATRPHDIVLDNLGPYEEFLYIGEVAATLSVLFLLYTSFKFNDLERIAIFFERSAAMFLLRSLAILITPLAQIHDPLLNPSAPPWAPYLYHGMFFSGHTATVAIVYFLDKHSRKTKLVKLFLTVVVGASLILSHSHYSIDVIGGLMAAYLVSSFQAPVFLKIKYYKFISKLQSFLNRKTITKSVLD